VKQLFQLIRIFEKNRFSHHKHTVKELPLLPQSTRCPSILVNALTKTIEEITTFKQGIVVFFQTLTLFGFICEVALLFIDTSVFGKVKRLMYVSVN